MQPFANHGKPSIHLHINFFKESSTTTQVVQTVAGATSITSGGATGAWVGASIGGKASFEGNHKLGMKVGMVVGGVIGIIFGAFGYLKITERRHIYQQWLERKKETTIYSEAFFQYANDPILKNFTCPLTCNIMLEPAVTPNGYLVEYGVIIQSPKASNGHVVCPFTRNTYSEIAILKDFERALLINKRALKVISSDIQQAEADQNVLHALEKHKAGLKAAVDICYQNCLDWIEYRRKSGTISFKECQAERESFANIFGQAPESELNWDLSWKELLRERWLKTHPNTPLFD
jgi:hypothetical protein